MGKRKCGCTCSAPEQRNKRNETDVINQEGTWTPSTTEKCARILRETDGMPFATFKKAFEELKDTYMAIYFIQMGWEYRLEWLYYITPPEKKRTFNRWRRTFTPQQ